MTTATETGTPQRPGAQAGHTGPGPEVVSSAADDARSIAQSAKGEAGAVADEAKAKAKDLASDARRQLRKQADDQTARAAGSMRELSSQLSTMADSADDGLAPDLVRQASSAVGDLAGRLDAGGLDTLVADLKRFARNRPGTFLLGAAAAGVIAGRLVRSSDIGSVVEAAKPNQGTEPDDTSPVGTTPSLVPSTAGATAPFATSAPAPLPDPGTIPSATGDGPRHASEF